MTLAAATGGAIRLTVTAGARAEDRDLIAGDAARGLGVGLDAFDLRVTDGRRVRLRLDAARGVVVLERVKGAVLIFR